MLYIDNGTVIRDIRPGIPKPRDRLPTILRGLKTVLLVPGGKMSGKFSKPPRDG